MDMDKNGSDFLATKFTSILANRTLKGEGNRD